MSLFPLLKINFCGEVFKEGSNKIFSQITKDAFLTLSKLLLPQLLILRKEPPLENPLKQLRDARKGAAPFIPLHIGVVQLSDIPRNNSPNAIDYQFQIVRQLLLTLRQFALLNLPPGNIHQHNFFP